MAKGNAAIRRLRETGTATITQTMSLDEVRRRYPDAAARGLLRHDCAFPGCQLSLGHPPPHCVRPDSLVPPGTAPFGEYWMVDDKGTVLRRV